MLTLAPTFDRPPRLLFLGAHSDDIEIGCGGTALRLLESYPDAEVCWVVFCARGERRSEALRSAAEYLLRVQHPDIRTFSFPDSHFPSHRREIKAEFEMLERFEPDVVLTHCGSDLHQDHRLVSELTWNTFRGHLVLEYEVPKYDADLRSPNLFVPLAPELCRKKLALLQKHFATQRARHWFDEELFRGLLRIRGAESRSPSGYAEGFYVRKLLVEPTRVLPPLPRQREDGGSFPELLQARKEVPLPCPEAERPGLASGAPDVAEVVPR